MAEISEEQLLTYVQEQERLSIGYSTDSLTNEADEALARYLGFPYGDEEDGRSQVISQDAAQVVDWALPDLLEPFVSGHKAVEFEPVKEEDEPSNEDATVYVNWIWSVDNPGFENLHSAAKDGLVQKLGVTKLLWNTSERKVEQTYVGQSSVDLARFRADDDVEVLNVESEPIKPTTEDALLIQAGQIPQIMQAFPDLKAYTITIEYTDDDGRLEVVSVPPEEFRISERASSTKEPQYIGHTTRKTKAELIEMGFDEALVEEAQDTVYGTKQGRDIRFYNQPHRDRNSDGTAVDWRGSRRWLHEEYVPLDMNGDGDIEVVQVFRVGNTILSTEEVICNPFGTFTPYPLPHSAIGQGMVDKIRQTMRAKTVLLRKFLDGVYLGVQPRFEVPEDAVTDDGSTYDDLLNPKIGSLIRTKKPGLLQPIALPDVTGTALSALEHFDKIRENDTGVVRAPIGLNSEAIDKELSATEAAQIERGSMKRDRLMARVFAEMYLAPLFSKMLKFLVQYQNKPRKIKLSGKWVDMDPRTWNSSMIAVPSVGLGHENRDSQAAAASVLAGFQEKATAIGMAGPEQFWSTAKLLVDALGLRFPEQYFVDPTTPEYKAAQEQQQEAPDPAMAAIAQRGQVEMAKVQQTGQIKAMELQQKGQLAQVEMQQNAQISLAKAQMEQQTDALTAQMKQAGADAANVQDFEAAIAKVQADFDAKMVQINRETAMAAEKMDREFALAIEEQNREFALAIRKQDIEEELAEQRAMNGSGISGGNGISSEANFGGPVG